MKPKNKDEQIIEEEAAETLDDVKEKLSDMQENLITYVKEHPLKSVGISIVAGLIVGQIFRRRK